MMGKPRLPANEPDAEGARSPGWPAWARRAVTAALLLHMTAVVAGALSMPPSSPLEQRVASLFAHYYELTDQGQAYRYYAPEPPPTPVVTARLRFADGRPEQQVRLPERGVWPRLRYQRQLALANHLYSDVQAAREIGGGEQASRWAASYARHLCKTRGCAGVTLFVQMHLIPDPAQTSAQRGVEIDSEEFYTAPERIGEFSCDAF
jgi:hypothetical protein